MTGANPPMPRFGALLPNGAIVIEAHPSNSVGCIVLCRTGGSEQYATWFMRYDDHTTGLGHYTRDLAEAVEDFRKRR